MLLAHCMDEVIEALQMDGGERRRTEWGEGKGEEEGACLLYRGEPRTTGGPGSCFFSIEFYP